jgi:hypothetical protein
MNYHLILLATVALLTPAWAQLPVATTSRVEIVPRAGGSTDYGVRSSMKINPVTGYPGIAHFDRAGGLLIYSAWNGTAWEERVVDSFTRQAGADYYYCSLAYDAAGVPNIAFFDRDQDDLKFARLTPTGFTSVLVDQLNGQFGTVGLYCALAFAPDGKAYLSYYHHEYEYLTQGSDETTTITSELRVATRSAAGVWSLATVDGPAGIDVGQHTALDVTATGYPVVSYLDVTHQKLKVAYFNGTSWLTRSLASAIECTAITSRSVPNDGIEIVYVWKDLNSNHLMIGSSTIFTTGSLNGVIFGFTSYAIETDKIARDPSIVFDRSGIAHLTYNDVFSGNLNIYHYLPSKTTNIIDTEDIVGTWSSLAIGPDGMASVCYYDPFNKNLRYAKLTGWATQILDSADDVGYSTSLSFSPQGYPAISYWDKTNGDLKYTERDAYGIWSIQAVATVGNVGSYPSLKFSPEGRPGISSYSLTNRDLIYSERLQNGTWNTQAVDTIGEVGLCSSLSYGPDGRISISYLDTINHDLKFAERVSNGLWSLQTVDGVSSDAESTSLVLGPDGRPGISYIDRSDSRLKFAERRANGTWNLQTLQNYYRAGGTTSMRINPKGNWGISFFSEGQSDFKYAERRADGTWSEQIIASLGGTNEHSSLSTNPAGQPAISFFSNILRYAERQADGIWHTSIVDRTGGGIGRLNSLGFAPGGIPMISYSDELNGDLKFAERFISPYPAEPTAPFQVLGLNRDPLTQATTLGWLGTPGGKYRVDFSPTLAAGSWQPLGDDINALDGMTFFRTSTLLGQSNPRAFFRVLRK